MSASYYPSQAYGQYPTSYPNYPQQGGYPPGQYAQSPTPGYVAFTPKPGTPPPQERHAAPELSAVTPELASHAFQRLVSVELRDAGFDSAEPAALRRLELEVTALVEQLYKRAHEYATLASRAGPIATDLLVASRECGLQTRELYRLATKKREGISELVLLPPPSRSPSPQLLSSDDEDVAPVIPATLRALPHYIPELPPKHTYLRTPISPPKKAALPSLEKKLKNAGLVQESLKNLLLATEDNTGQDDAELLGATVNWEATTHPRKKWRIS